MTRFDTVLVGRKSFEATLAQGGGDVLSGMDVHVFSSRLVQEDHPRVSVSDDPVGTVRRPTARGWEPHRCERALLRDRPPPPVPRRPPGR